MYFIDWLEIWDKYFFFRYGDKVFKIIVGKLLGFVWMLVGFIIIIMFISIIIMLMMLVSFEGWINLWGVMVGRGLEWVFKKSNLF